MVSSSNLPDAPTLIADIAGRSLQLLLCCEKNFTGECKRIVGDQLSRFKLRSSYLSIFTSFKASVDYRLRTAFTARVALEGNLEILCIHLLSALAGQEDISDETLRAFYEASLENISGFGTKLLNQSASSTEARHSALGLVEDVQDTLHQLSLGIREEINESSLVKVDYLETDEAFSLVKEIMELNNEPDSFLPSFQYEATQDFEAFVRRVLEIRWLKRDTTVILDDYQMEYRKTMFERCVSLISTRRRQLAYFRRNQTELSMPANQIYKLTELDSLPARLEKKESSLSLSDPTKQGLQHPSFTELADIVPSETTDSELQSSAFNLSPLAFATLLASIPSDPGRSKTTGLFEVPPTPELEANEKEKMCPYCYIVYPAKVFSDDKKPRLWKKHLIEDLQPYLCLYKNCDQVGKTYSRFKDWRAHLEKTHVQRYLCPLSHPTTDDSKEKMYFCDTTIQFWEHMNLYHADIDEFSAYRILRSAKQSAILSHWCFVCLSEQPSAASLQKHLANHLEQAFLLALPRGDDINDMVTNSQVSERNSGTLSTDIQGLSLLDMHGVDEPYPSASNTCDIQNLSHQNFTAALSAIDTHSILEKTRDVALYKWVTELSSSQLKSFSYQCLLCPSQTHTYTRSSFRRHVNDRHQPKSELLCHYCPFSSAREDEIRDHLEYHVGRKLHQVDLRLIECPLPIPKRCELCNRVDPPFQSWNEWFDCVEVHCRIVKTSATGDASEAKASDHLSKVDSPFRTAHLLAAIW